MSRLSLSLITSLEYKAYELRRKLILLTGKIGGAHLAEASP